mgnify:CR=1 FL=1
MIAFTLSACSFWPFAHISAVNFKEQKELMSKEDSLEIMKSIWGKPKLDKNR